MKHRFTRFFALLLTAALLVSALPIAALAVEQNPAQPFSDVAADAWYAESVDTVYRLGLMQGSGGRFRPDGSITLAEAITMAARLHSSHADDGEAFQQGTPWYQVYLDYAVKTGILKQGEFSELNRAATRAQMAHIFAAALPQTELKQINSVTALPDVKAANPYSADILRLYNAGVLTGNDAQGTFTPNTAISRAQAAAILARLAVPSLRKSFQLEFSVQNVAAKLSDAVKPLAATRTLKKADAVGGITAFSNHWIGTQSQISENLSQSPTLAYSLTFSDQTRFSSLPAGYDPVALLEWGKSPGLNVDLLHKYGFTGKSATIAYIDQPIGAHSLYSKINVHYTNNSGVLESMHGPAVLSLLAAQGIGTAPEAEIYYYAHASWKADQATHTQCLYQIIEQNKSLPEGKKITMVGFSDNIDPSEANVAAFQQAVAACEKAGIMVWFCGEYSGASFLPLSDKNNPENLTYESWGGSQPTLMYVPSSGRTTAANMGGASYIYWASGGLSWTMPYALGLYAIVNEIDPSLTQAQLRKLIVDTAQTNSAGMRVVNPVGFVAAALRGVGRDAEAQTLEDEAATRQKYLYAVMDTAALSQSDLTAIGSYLANITNATVLVADASGFSNAQELYRALQSDAAARGGSVVGVQLFGIPEMVPAFQIGYRVQMLPDVDDGGTFLTDYFYSNFNNDAAKLGPNYNVLEHFANNWKVDLSPDWPVARLPLAKGEFAAFFDKYQDFAATTGLKRLELVNFSNPIFNQKQHTDDMSVFLNRMSREFKLLTTPYRLYANQQGDVPVTEPVLGGFTRENLAKENDRAPMELLINSHGQWNNIDQCLFVGGQEKRVSLLNLDTINTTLDANAYYLDCWTCSNGYNMANNLTTAALNGNCVGAFTATAIISNNGVNCRASVEQMKNSNFYYFYYSYLKALHEGNTRSGAFFAAQQAYSAALLLDSKKPLRAGSNYQFNLYNLLVYHNFGVIEPNAAAMALSTSEGYIAQAGQSVPKQTVPNFTQTSSGMNANRELLSDGKSVGTVKTIKWTEMNELQPAPIPSTPIPRKSWTTAASALRLTTLHLRE